MLLWVFTLVFAASCSARYNPHFAPEDPPDALLKFLQDTHEGAGAARDAGRAGDGGREPAGAPLLLTPLIERGELQAARAAARVDADRTLFPVDSYAGYLTVNKEYNANLWFWYFPVSGGGAAEATPWITWLQGGPGVSSTYGLFNEIGPFTLNQEDQIEEMKYSWGKNHSLLFIDNPVGTGFSFTSDKRGYATNQTTIGENLYTALQQFLTLFPELRRAPLTIAGESYAGKHIPSLGIQILRRREKDREQPINLQGLAIGNGFIDPVSLQHYSRFLREVGLVDDATADRMQEMEAQVVRYINGGQISDAYYEYSWLLRTIKQSSHRDNLYNFVREKAAGPDGPHVTWLRRADVRRALHVGDTPFGDIFDVYWKLIPDFMNSAKPWLEELLENYRVMLYNGHLDIIVAYHPSVSTYNSLTFSGAAEYRAARRQAWYHDQELAGYFKLGGNLTEVMVLGAGHMVPGERPAQALGLISAFARGRPLTDTRAPPASH